MRNAIPEICIVQDSIYHSKPVEIIFFKINPIYKNPAKMKAIPPTISCFQDIIKITSRIRDGRLCINNPIIVSQKV